MKSNRIVVRRAAIGSFCAALVIAVFTSITWAQIDEAAWVSDATHADAVVVLGCAVQPGGVPSPALRARIEEGIRTWRTTGSRYLFLTGGVGKNPPAEAEVMHRIATREGVPDAAIIEDTSAHRTEDSAIACARTARDRGWTRIVLVSDPWHLLRAHRMFSDEEPALDIRQSPAFESEDWTNAGSRVGYTLRECVACPVYCLKRTLRGQSGL